MKRLRNIVIILMFAFFLLMLAVVPLSVPTPNNELEAIVAHCLTAVIQDQTVATSSGFHALPDSTSVTSNGRLYFENKLGIPDTIFLAHGLKPMPQDRELDYSAGEARVVFSFEDIEGNPTKNVQFSYVYGWLGAQGLEIQIFQSFLYRYYEFQYRWES